MLDVKRLPWRGWTVALTLVSIVAFFWPTLTEVLIYDRGLIGSGQVWRIWTGHCTHVNLSHLFWNLAVFVPAGFWLERLQPRLTAWFYLGAALGISLGLYFADPSLLRYSGLSGIATGQLVLLAIVQLRTKNDEPSWFWLAVLGLITVKVGMELTRPTPVFVDFANGVRNVPLAHIGGIVCALIAASCYHPTRAAPTPVA
jgi:rhomboid family GlyGly-CTERM serine protease